MNLTGEKPISTVASAPAASGRRQSFYITAVAFPAFVVLAYGQMLEQLPFPLVYLASAGLYVAGIYFYYGIAELAFEHRTYLLWAGAVAAYVLGFMASGLANVWTVMAGASMFLFGGAIVGRMSFSAHRPGRIYLLAAAAVALFFTAQFGGMWGPIMAQMSADTPKVLAELEPAYRSLGASDAVTQDALALVERLFLAMVRLVPALTVMGVLTQFSVGFLIFAHLVSRRQARPEFWTSFRRWRMPFGFTPVVAVIIVARLLGNDTARLLADNILAILAVYYCVAGLALIEYYMSKLSLPPLLRFSFYLLLFVTQFLSLLAATAVLGTMILLGFVDSFTDWRREPPVGETA